MNATSPLNSAIYLYIDKATSLPRSLIHFVYYCNFHRWFLLTKHFYYGRKMRVKMYYLHIITKL